MAAVPERHPVIRQVYTFGAVLAFVGTFMPLFAVEALESDYTTRNLWGLIGEDGGWAAALGLVVMLAMVSAALLATAPERGFAAPSGVLALALVSLLMLVLKPGTGGSPPSLGAGGGLLLGTVLVLAVAALVDVLATPRANAPYDDPPITLPG